MSEHGESYKRAQAYAQKAMDSSVVRLSPAEAKVIHAEIALAYNEGYGAGLKMFVDTFNQQHPPEPKHPSASGGQS